MTTQEPQTRAVKQGARPADYIARLRDLQRREWWTWGVSVFVMVLLTFAIASLALPSILAERKAGFGSEIFQAVSGLTILILLFACYLTYEKLLINRLRLDLAERQSHSVLWRNLALVDPLTGLYNRRFAERTIRAEIARAQRKGYALTLVLFDLDSFKQINDRFGHAAGDIVLKEFANRLTKAVREADTAARLGGDEFMLLLTECDSAQVQSVLERLRSIEVTLAGQRIPIEFSVGWKEYEQDESLHDLMIAADKALYQNKQGSKNLPAFQEK
jgi:diguanylate cyclase (GGDEF)-like protein